MVNQKPEKSLETVIKNAIVNRYEMIRPLLPNRYIAFRFPGGQIYLNIRESPMMLERALGIYEHDKMMAVRSLLKPGNTFVDVGGNKGDFALMAAKIVEGSGSVLCFEPEPTNCHWIRQSILLNGYSNVSLFEFALSDFNGESRLHLGTKSGLHSLLSGRPNRDQGAIAVKTRTLDSLLLELGRDRVDVMKVDVEGAELQVLMGAEQTLKKNPNIVLLIDIHPFLGVKPAEVFDLLHSLGFAVCRMSQPYTVPAALDDTTSEVLAKRPDTL